MEIVISEYARELVPEYACRELDPGSQVKGPNPASVLIFRAAGFNERFWMRSKGRLPEYEALRAALHQRLGTGTPAEAGFQRLRERLTGIPFLYALSGRLATLAHRHPVDWDGVFNLKPMGRLQGRNRVWGGASGSSWFAWWIKGSPYLPPPPPPPPFQPSALEIPPAPASLSQHQHQHQHRYPHRYPRGAPPAPATDTVAGRDGKGDPAPSRPSSTGETAGTAGDNGGRRCAAPPGFPRQGAHGARSSGAGTNRGGVLASATNTIWLALADQRVLPAAVTATAPLCTIRHRLPMNRELVPRMPRVATGVSIPNRFRAFPGHGS